MRDAARYLVGLALALAGVVEFVVRALFVLLLVLSIAGWLVLDQLPDDVLDPFLFKLAERTLA